MRHKDEKRLVFGFFSRRPSISQCLIFWRRDREPFFFDVTQLPFSNAPTLVQAGPKERVCLAHPERGEQPTCAIGSRPNARRRSHTDHRTLWTNFGREKLGKEGERRRMPFFFEKPLIYARLSFRLEESGGK